MLGRTLQRIRNFHLISRSDGSLALALFVATVILFQRPLHSLLEVARDVETRYQVDLLPALAVLLTVFMFHGYQKWQRARSQARAAAADAAQMRVRLEELEQLMTFSQSLANALDRGAIQQVLWRYLPTFARDRETWILLALPGGTWDPLLMNSVAPDSSPDRLEALATATLAGGDTGAPASDGVLSRDDQICFAMRASGRPLGVMGVRNAPALGPAERKTLATAAALIGIALRNVQLLQDTREHALHDGLTGCFNHAHGMETLSAELRRAKRTQRPLSVLMFDLDRFKEINDRLGHLRGDAVLAAVGARLAEVLRASDICCRYGGDEFLVILPDTPVIGAEQVAASLRREISALSDDPSGPSAAAISASFGVVGTVAGELDAIAVVARADEALYRAKQEGRNRFCVAPAPADRQAGTSTASVSQQ